ncbi:MAG: translation initiation factor IF-2 subunit beta [Candidatus Thermoplasmatota archaeon]|nr:translation initiation factor IF-2 subunit beta [Candidatus Thermoplasmatota archaeon]
MAYDYRALLKRARERLPEKVKEKSRLEVPKCDIFYEGKTTIIKNFTEIAEVIRRSEDHLLAYLLRELGTAGVLEARRAVLKGNVSAESVEERLKDYVKTFVLCWECNKPDTHLEKAERVLILKCDACGAHRPVTVRVTKE